jgi:hypothetical protein
LIPTAPQPEVASVIGIMESAGWRATMAGEAVAKTVFSVAEAGAR